jgi:hypothetical protein
MIMVQVNNPIFRLDLRCDTHHQAQAPMGNSQVP